MTDAPEGYLGAHGPVGSGPSETLVEAGYLLEIADAEFLHRGLGLADIAHLLELSDLGVLPDEAGRTLGGEILRLLDVPWEAFPYNAWYGDAYNSRERELERMLGTIAGWLPAGRTRREAGRIAFRLALRLALLDLHEAIADFGLSVSIRADELAGAPWNDTTYLQPAQPSTFGHYLAGFAVQVVRDLERVRHAHGWVDRSPAGVGGVAGSRIPFDRERLAHALGFATVAAHTRDIMWSVDGLVDVVVAATQAVTNLDRLAEDLEIFASPQFGYVSLGGSSSRASVLLPQKRNPYSLAVIRGGVGTLIGRVTGLMVTQRTPSARTDNWLYGYGEVMTSVRMATRLLRLGSEVVGGMAVDVEAMMVSAGSHFSVAADLTEILVLEAGLDYRSAYLLVGRAVAESSAAGNSDLSVDNLVAAAAEMNVVIKPEQLAAAHDLVADAATLARSRDVVGGSAPGRVREQCASIREEIGNAQRWARDTRARHGEAADRLIERARSRWE